ncbi:MAG: hypothetical protein AAGB26_16385 [Planctomycetota bacterium]
MRSSTKIICLLLLGSLSGCTAVRYPGFAYASWKRDLINDRSLRTYNKAVGRQAGDGQLLGTWVRSEETPLGKKIFNKRTDHYTLTLFKDNSYIFKIDSREPYIKNVVVTHGKWLKAGPGVIELIRNDVSETGKPHMLELSQWSNIFVSMSAELNEAEAAE